MNESSMDNGFFRWVRELGLQRGEDHWVGGVSCGVAQRFGISPILVRGIFVALCFVAGVGLLLYGLAWARWADPLPGGPRRALEQRDDRRVDLLHRRLR